MKTKLLQQVTLVCPECHSVLVPVPVDESVVWLHFAVGNYPGPTCSKAQEKYRVEPFTVEAEIEEADDADL